MNPAQAATRWHQWSAAGTADEIARLLEALARDLPAGWRAANSDEFAPLWSVAWRPVGWYSLEPAPGHAGVTLSVASLVAGDLRGGQTWFRGPPGPAGVADIPAAWWQVMRLLDDGIAPAARAEGVFLRLPAVEDLFLSDLPSDVAHRLRDFSDGSDKSLPLGDTGTEDWHQFVLAAARAGVPVAERALAEWLAGAGWPGDAAAKLAARFSDETRLLRWYASEALAL